MKIAGLSLVLVILAGCAATPISTSSAPRLSPIKYEIDAEKIAKVEGQARAAGARIIWINAPYRRVEVD